MFISKVLVKSNNANVTKVVGDQRVIHLRRNIQKMTLKWRLLEASATYLP